MIKMINFRMGDKAMGMKREPTDSVKAMMKPPNNAPTKFPIPPRTTTTKAVSKKSHPTLGVI